MGDEEGQKMVPAEERRYPSLQRMMSPEIVEIGEDSSSSINTTRDVYVAVGRDDVDVLKWALDHAVVPGVRVFLVHVFPPITHIPTPVGRISRSQFNQSQLRVYLNEQHNRRRSLLHKYVTLCTDAQVTVDTLLLESNETAKAILELISVLNITNLVMGTKHPPSSRRLWKGMIKGEFIQRKAPDFCEVTIVFEGRKVEVVPEASEPVTASPASSHRRHAIAQHQERKFFECVCFSGKFN